MILKEYLNKPFPFIEKTKYRLLASILVSVFVYVFLMIFQPFGISNIQYYKPIFVLGFFVITLIVLFFSFLIAPLICKEFFDSDNWTIRKNTIFIISQFIIISILNWAYNSTLGKDVTTQHSLMFFVFITTTVGIFPTLFLMYFIEINLTRKNQDFANDFTENIPEKLSKTEEIKIILNSKNKAETFKINLNQLICIKSEGNYLNVFYFENDKIISRLIRNSISKIEEQLSKFNKIKRSHRSYIVNLDKVDKMTGNARNFNLHIDDLGFKIPVSRSFPKEILKNLNI